MANSRREANKERSRRNGMSQREATHREPSYKGEGYRSDGSHGEESRSTGSHAHVGERRGPGPVPGAGELELPHNGPGKASETNARMNATSFPSAKTPGAEKDVSEKSRGREED